MKSKATRIVVMLVVLGAMAAIVLSVVGGAFAGVRPPPGM
jgi:hypothetical protein